MSKTVAVLKAASSAFSRIMDEAPVLMVGGIVFSALHMSGSATLGHDIAVAGLSSIATYMTNRGGAKGPPAPPAPPAS